MIYIEYFLKFLNLLGYFFDSRNDTQKQNFKFKINFFNAQTSKSN